MQNKRTIYQELSLIHIKKHRERKSDLFHLHNTVKDARGMPFEADQTQSLCKDTQLLSDRIYLEQEK